MNALSPIKVGVERLRDPFPAHHISKLPKPTKAQTEAVKADFKKGVRCKDCGSWHHPDVVHLDYVGHAAITDRLLDTDPAWSWEPLAFRDGLPAFDGSGGLWIKLTVCGISRLGYGHAAAKPGVDPGAREKEVIGDALRNAAMRFGAALDLWHKGDLHLEEEAETTLAKAPDKPVDADEPTIDKATWTMLSTLVEASGKSVVEICRGYGITALKHLPARKADKLAERLRAVIADKGGKPAPSQQSSDILADDIPY